MSKKTNTKGREVSYSIMAYSALYGPLYKNDQANRIVGQRVIGYSALRGAIYRRSGGRVLQDED